MSDCFDRIANPRSRVLPRTERTAFCSLWAAMRRQTVSSARHRKPGGERGLLEKHRIAVLLVDQMDAPVQKSAKNLV